MKLSKLKNLTIALLTLITHQLSFGQGKSISITIDDVPNTSKFEQDGFKSILMNRLDSLDIPFTVFINEDKISKTDFTQRNEQLLEVWIKNKNALIGNHTFSHPRYSDVGLDNFMGDVEKGERLTKAYASKHKKNLKYFRFPFNDLGLDSLQHTKVKAALSKKGYIITPFTVESSDWMFDTVYQYYLNNGQTSKAHEVGEAYVNKTIELVTFFDSLASQIYNYPVKHIYLCHDNAINADYLSKIIERLNNENYEIISLEESLTDPIYQQEDTYYKKWGISWLYRWMPTQKERVKWMQQEPDLSEIQSTYDELTKK
ncbi:polysaccharide deacetylase [Roseivirga seohaensis subsp. aquiponti]|uniref:Polysaccharide deacetylase n=1 Tax=Roseivirga seohaensis subsp. aquiponti TaxID=1566026 RepID=A0A0L8AMY5_9BACT|nr:polysaccharide deacetylase family protein [Roseivirga seohaensis]KOF03838.1 polysaccharide deacetylase [Roseivirga seohaensis subsp. aquiponti]